MCVRLISGLYFGLSCLDLQYSSFHNKLLNRQDGLRSRLFYLELFHIKMVRMIYSLKKHILNSISSQNQNESTLPWFPNGKKLELLEFYKEAPIEQGIECDESLTFEEFHQDLDQVIDALDLTDSEASSAEDSGSETSESSEDEEETLKK